MFFEKFKDFQSNSTLSTSFFFNSQLVHVKPNDWLYKDVKSCELKTIGYSRDGRKIKGIKVGNGPLNVSVVAGAHSDEPVGPRTALYLAEGLAFQKNDFFEQLSQVATWWIVPHVNPDGEVQNLGWMTEDSHDFKTYSNHVFREKPGEDVEFCYPENKEELSAILRQLETLNTNQKQGCQDGLIFNKEKYSLPPRPENIAVAGFLSECPQPFDLHLSLHSMAVANGAWYLVCREWAEKWKGSEAEKFLIQESKNQNLSLHDWDRKGDKGFSGISPGFSTTPRSDAMRDFFLKQNDEETARKFRPSSMEYVRSLGGDPLCLVSELPRYVIGSGEVGKSSGHLPQFLEFAKRWREAKDSKDESKLDQLLKEIPLKEVSLETQSYLQMAFISAGLELVRSSK